MGFKTREIIQKSAINLGFPIPDYKQLADICQLLFIGKMPIVD